MLHRPPFLSAGVGAGGRCALQGKKEWQRLMHAQRPFLSCAQVRPVFCFPDVAAIYSPVLLLFCPYPLWSTQCLYFKKSCSVLKFKPIPETFLKQSSFWIPGTRTPWEPFSHLFVWEWAWSPTILAWVYIIACSVMRFFSFPVGWSCAVFFRSYSGWAGDVAQLREGLSGMHKASIPSTT